MKRCDKCGSENIEVTKHKKITGPPKGKKRHPFKKITYGYVYFKYVCECGNSWEEKTNL